MLFPEWSPRYEPVGTGANRGKPCVVSDQTMVSFDQWLNISTNADMVITDCVYHVDTLNKNVYIPDVDDTPAEKISGPIAWKNCVDEFIARWSGTKRGP